MITKKKTKNQKKRKEKLDTKPLINLYFFLTVVGQWRECIAHPAITYFHTSSIKKYKYGLV